MVVAKYPKLFDVQCIWGMIFVSLEIFFLTIHRLLFQLLGEIYIEKELQELFEPIFRVPMPFKPYQITSGCGTASRDSEIKGAIVRIKNTNAIPKRPVNKLFLI